MLEVQVAGVGIAIETDSSLVRDVLCAGRPEICEETGSQTRIRITKVQSLPDPPKGAVFEGRVGGYLLFVRGHEYYYLHQDCLYIIDRISHKATCYYLDEVRSLDFIHPIIESLLAWELGDLDIYRIHASAIDLKGKATIIVGTSSSGKTSLTLSLLERAPKGLEAKMICDDTVFFDSSNHKVYGFMPWICVEPMAITSKIISIPNERVLVKHSFPNGLERIMVRPPVKRPAKSTPSHLVHVQIWRSQDPKIEPIGLMQATRLLMSSFMEKQRPCFIETSRRHKSPKCQMAMLELSSQLRTYSLLQGQDLKKNADAVLDAIL